MISVRKQARRYLGVITIPPCGPSPSAAIMALMCVLFVRVLRSQDALSLREGA